MKKKYIIPQVDIIRISTMQMIALSGILDSDPEQSITNSDDFQSREAGFDVFDDED